MRKPEEAATYPPPRREQHVILHQRNSGRSIMFGRFFSTRVLREQHQVKWASQHVQLEEDCAASAMSFCESDCEAKSYIASWMITSQSNFIRRQSRHQSGTEQNETFKILGAKGVGLFSNRAGSSPSCRKTLALHTSQTSSSSCTIRP